MDFYVDYGFASSIYDDWFWKIFYEKGSVLLVVGMDDEQSAKRVHVQRIGFERLIRHGEAHDRKSST